MILIVEEIIYFVSWKCNFCLFTFKYESFNWKIGEIRPFTNNNRTHFQFRLSTASLFIGLNRRCGSCIWMVIPHWDDRCFIYIITFQHSAPLLSCLIYISTVFKSTFVFWIGSITLCSSLANVIILIGSHVYFADMLKSFAI